MMTEQQQAHIEAPLEPLDIGYPEEVLQIMRRLRNIVDAAGNATVAVKADEGEEKTHPVPFAYTIGAAQYNLPDVVVVADIAASESVQLVNLVLDYWHEHGLTLDTPADLLGNLRYKLVPLDTNKIAVDWVCQAEVFNQVYPDLMQRSEDVHAYVQLLLPDQNGRLPGEEAFDAENPPQLQLPVAVTE